MKKLTITLLIILLSSTTVWALAIGSSLGNKDFRKKIEITVGLWDLCSPEHPVRVLDVGTYNGQFLPRIKKVLESVGYHVIVEGVENLAIFPFTIKEKVELKRENVFKLLNDDPSIKVWDLSIEDAHKNIQYKYDMIFISAPWPFVFKSDKNFLEGSMKLLAEEGTIFLRYHARETMEIRYKWIKQICKENGFVFKIIDTTGIIPIGSFELDEDLTFIIRKNDKFFNQSIGKSMGEFLKAVFYQKEIGRAA